MSQACNKDKQFVSPAVIDSHLSQNEKHPHPCDPPSFGIILVLPCAHRRLVLKRRENGLHRRTILTICAEKIGLLVHEHGHVKAQPLSTIPHALHYSQKMYSVPSSLLVEISGALSRKVE